MSFSVCRGARLALSIGVLDAAPKYSEWTRFPWSCALNASAFRLQDFILHRICSPTLGDTQWLEVFWSQKLRGRYIASGRLWNCLWKMFAATSGPHQRAKENCRAYAGTCSVTATRTELPAAKETRRPVPRSVPLGFKYMNEAHSKRADSGLRNVRSAFDIMNSPPLMAASGAARTIDCNLATVSSSDCPPST